MFLLVYNNLELRIVKVLLAENEPYRGSKPLQNILMLIFLLQ